VSFNGLTEENVRMIVKKSMNEFITQLRGKNIELEVTDEAYTWLAKKGYSPEFGAREIARIVQEHVKKHFVDEVLFGKLSGGGKACVAVEKDEVIIRIDEQ